MTATPAALISPATRIAAALAVMAAVGLAWVGAEDASREAVATTQAQLQPSREALRIQLPTVVVTGQREVEVASLPVAAF